MSPDNIVPEYLVDFHDFPREEYDLRWGRARKLMAEQTLDGLMVTGDFCSAMNYPTSPGTCRGTINKTTPARTFFSCPWTATQSSFRFL